MGFPFFHAMQCKDLIYLRTHILDLPLIPDLTYRDRGGGGAGRAIALPLFCWDLLCRAPVDMGKIPENYWTLP